MQVTIDVFSVGRLIKLEKDIRLFRVKLYPKSPSCYIIEVHKREVIIKCTDGSRVYPSRLKRYLTVCEDTEMIAIKKGKITGESYVRLRPKNPATIVPSLVVVNISESGMRLDL